VRAGMLPDLSLMPCRACQILRKDYQMESHIVLRH
jgi:hypothetical protein